MIHVKLVLLLECALTTEADFQAILPTLKFSFPFRYLLCMYGWFICFTWFRLVHAFSIIKYQLRSIFYCVIFWNFMGKTCFKFGVGSANCCKLFLSFVFWLCNISINVGVDLIYVAFYVELWYFYDHRGVWVKWIHFCTCFQRHGKLIFNSSF